MAGNAIKPKQDQIKITAITPLARRLVSAASGTRGVAVGFARCRSEHRRRARAPLWGRARACGLGLRKWLRVRAASGERQCWVLGASESARGRPDSADRVRESIPWVAAERKPPQPARRRTPTGWRRAAPGAHAAPTTPAPTAGPQVRDKRTPYPLTACFCCQCVFYWFRILSLAVKKLIFNWCLFCACFFFALVA
jgi:hypothetical protein